MSKFEHAVLLINDFNLSEAVLSGFRGEYALSVNQMSGKVKLTKNNSTDIVQVLLN